MRLKALPTAIVLALVLTSTAARVLAAERVTVAVGSHGTMDYVPIEVAHALGFFTEQGLQVDLQYFQSGTMSATALLSGTVDFGAGSFDHAMKAALKGKTLTAIAAFTEVPSVLIVVGSRHRTAVREPADLKGRPVAVTGLGAYSHLILVHVLTRAGLKAEEIQAIPVGGEALAAALENDRVHAMMAAGLIGAKLIETGRAFVLVDLRSRAAADRLFGGPYLRSTLMTRPGVCTEQAETCTKLVRGIVKAIRWLERRTSAAIAAALPMTLVQDRRLYAAALDENRDGFSRTARIEPGAVDTVVASYRASGAMTPTQAFDPTVLYDNRFVDRVLAEGR
jgi:NitT/TauT family transport system substrate-binding protein